MRTSLKSSNPCRGIRSFLSLDEFCNFSPVGSFAEYSIFSSLSSDIPSFWGLLFSSSSADLPSFWGLLFSSLSADLPSFWGLLFSSLSADLASFWGLLFPLSSADLPSFSGFWIFLLFSSPTAGVQLIWGTTFSVCCSLPASISPTSSSSSTSSLAREISLNLSAGCVKKSFDLMKHIKN